MRNVFNTQFKRLTHDIFVFTHNYSKRDITASYVLCLGSFCFVCSGGMQTQIIKKKIRSKKLNKFSRPN